MSNRTFLAVAISTCVVALGCSTATHSLTGETAGVSGASAPGGTGGRDAGAGGTSGASGGTDGASAPGGTGGRDAGAGGMGGSGSGGTIGSGMRGCPGVGGTSPPPCPQTILSIMSYLASCTPGLACTFGASGGDPSAWFAGLLLLHPARMAPSIRTNGVPHFNLVSLLAACRLMRSPLLFSYSNGRLFGPSTSRRRGRRGRQDSPSPGGTNGSPAPRAAVQRGHHRRAPSGGRDRTAPR